MVLIWKKWAQVHTLGEENKSKVAIFRGHKVPNYNRKPPFLGPYPQKKFYVLQPNLANSSCA
jgi:hypothetical protein